MMITVAFAPVNQSFSISCRQFCFESVWLRSSTGIESLFNTLTKSDLKSLTYDLSSRPSLDPDSDTALVHLQFFTETLKLTHAETAGCRVWARRGAWKGEHPSTSGRWRRAQGTQETQGTKAMGEKSNPSFTHQIR